MRLAFLTLLLVAPGCVAHHKIIMESEPPGAHVEMNGEYLGATPVEYVLESRYAEEIWPEAVTLVARTAGWRFDVKEFAARSPLPGRIFFVLNRDPTRTVREPASVPETEDVDMEYETLDEQKRRLRSGTSGE